jgi:hypothetical protein
MKSPSHVQSPDTITLVNSISLLNQRSTGILDPPPVLHPVSTPETRAFELIRVRLIIQSTLALMADDQPVDENMDYNGRVDHEDQDNKPQ